MSVSKLGSSCLKSGVLGLQVCTGETEIGGSKCSKSLASRELEAGLDYTESVTHTQCTRAHTEIVYNSMLGSKFSMCEAWV